MPHHISDHAPLKVIMHLNTPNRNKLQLIFKFLNTLVGEDDLMETIRNIWNREADGKPMMRLWRKLKRLQPILMGLSKRISYVVHNLKGYMNNLAQAQQKLNGDMFNSEYIQDVKYWTKEI